MGGDGGGKMGQGVKVSKSKCQTMENDAWSIKSSRKVWLFHFYFLLLSPTYASRPTRLGFWADSVWLRICLYLWKSVYFALFLTLWNLENFLCLSELSNSRCSCSVYKWFYARYADLHWSAIMCCRWLYKLHCVGSALPVQQTRVFQNLYQWNRQMSGSTHFH